MTKHTSKPATTERFNLVLASNPSVDTHIFCASSLQFAATIYTEIYFNNFVPLHTIQWAFLFLDAPNYAACFFWFTQNNSGTHTSSVILSALRSHDYLSASVRASWRVRVGFFFSCESSFL